jgi:hypothetical protein
VALRRRYTGSERVPGCLKVGREKCSVPVPLFAEGQEEFIQTFQG